MPARVEGKVAIVTGAASGIGRACAGRLAAEGARVVLADVAVEAGRAAAGQVGRGALFLAHDVSDEDSWRELVAETERRCGRLDALVNNAGVLVAATVEETTVEQWRRVQAVNAEGVFLGCKHALPALRRAGGGSIVNVSSIAALVGTPPYAAYSASKGAVRSLTKTVAVHCRSRGDAIRCNSIHPGGVRTPMVGAAVEGSPDEPALPAARLAGMAAPEEIAHLVVYLVSDESRYVNGAELVIDGGTVAA
jgi:3(or 17)beta-hydroxysteroid dehydrogenase